MVQYIVLGGLGPLTDGAIKAVQDRNRKVADHFDSETLAENYLNGLIDWDGNEICDIHGAGGCPCLDPAW